MDRFSMIITVIFLICISLTYMLHRFFSRRRFIKYLPAVLSLIIMVISIFIARKSRGEGFRDLAGIILAVICFAAFLSSLLSALYFDFISPRLKK